MNIDKSEVLRYLGHRGQAYGEGLDRLIDESIALCGRIARPQHVLRVFDLDWAEGTPTLRGAGLPLSGRDIAAHLSGAAACALLAATLGVEVERQIRILEQSDLTASLVLDACATECIEGVCDRAGQELLEPALARSLRPGTRFSPGYGDLPLALQPDILRLVDATRRIGLTCTDHLILLPRKSVTAVIGLYTDRAGAPGADTCSAPGPGGCAACTLRETCPYRRGRPQKGADAPCQP